MQRSQHRYITGRNITMKIQAVHMDQIHRVFFERVANQLAVRLTGGFAHRVVQTLGSRRRGDQSAVYLRPLGRNHKRLVYLRREGLVDPVRICSDPPTACVPTSVSG